MRRGELLARTLLLAGALSALTNCRSPRHAQPGPPAALVGAFEDDYGERYQISAETWRHGAHTTYLVVEWHTDAQYVLARNASTNASAPGLWTRIDWVRLTGMPPYDWGFCLSAYDAPTRALALATKPADRSSPRIGCNGFPFSRMKRQP